MKPTGIVDYLFPWFIPLFCFFAGYFIGTVVQVKIEPVTTSLRLFQTDERNFRYVSRTGSGSVGNLATSPIQQYSEG